MTIDEIRDFAARARKALETGKDDDGKGSTDFGDEGARLSDAIVIIDLLLPITVAVLRDHWNDRATAIAALRAMSLHDCAAGCGRKAATGNVHFECTVCAAAAEAS